MIGIVILIILRMRVFNQKRTKIDYLFGAVVERYTHLVVFGIDSVLYPDVLYSFRVIRSAVTSVFRMKNVCHFSVISL